jgi:TonB family protein
MRNILVATLALAPVLVHAQAVTPAQPGAQTPVLESKLVSPKAADSAAPANFTQPTAILLEPKLVKWTNVDEDGRDVMRDHERSVTVSMTVTERGVPTHLKVVDSDDPLLNRGVLEAVAQYRFSPASLDSRPTAMPLVLKVRVLPQSK